MDNTPPPVHFSFPLGVRIPSSQADVVPPVRVLGPVRYHGTAEEDAELLKIFERTYGPVKARQLIPVKRTEPAAVTSGVKELSGGEVLLVDGYNMVFAWDELKKLAQSSLDDARRPPSR